MHIAHVSVSETLLVGGKTADYLMPAIVHRTNESLFGRPRTGCKRKTEMTTITLSRATVRNHGVGSTPGFMSAVKFYLARTRAERQLRQLDDRMLADIGLKRTDIGRSVWGS
jgi:uncharacterized protein YjiS (DUF1127 family)